MLWFLPVFPYLVCSNSIARQMLVPSNKKFRTRHISSISRLGTSPGPGTGMGFLLQWDNEQVQSQTICTSTFFSHRARIFCETSNGKAGDEVSNSFLYCKENKKKYLLRAFLSKANLHTSPRKTQETNFTTIIPCSIFVAAKVIWIFWAIQVKIPLMEDIKLLLQSILKLISLQEQKTMNKKIQKQVNHQLQRICV